MTCNEMALMANIAVDMQKNEVNDVLDKIRAEILNKAYRNFDEHINDYTDEVVDLDDVLDIIDKYKSDMVK